MGFAHVHLESQKMGVIVLVDKGLSTMSAARMAREVVVAMLVVRAKIVDLTSIVNLTSLMKNATKLAQNLIIKQLFLFYYLAINIYFSL